MQDKTLMRLRNWITDSGLARGARLPPERELSAALGVSRTDLRNAFLLLASEGLLDRHVGRGTYLTKSTRSQPKARGIEAAVSHLSETTGPTDAMAARLVLEPDLARMAALSATPLQLRRLRELAASMRVATSWSAYETFDYEFHSAIAAASGNAMLTALFEIVNRVRQVVVWRKLAPSDCGPDPSYHSFDEHDAILAALDHRDGAAAAMAMTAHLHATLAALTDTAPV